VLVARFYRIPVVIHISDAVPSRTGRVSAIFAKAIALGFADAQKYFSNKKNNVIVVGNPVRADVFGQQIAQADARTGLGMASDLPLILVLGGSQGATRINDFILDNVNHILEFTQVLHQTGKNNYETVVKEFGIIQRELPEELSKRYKAVPYFEGDISAAFSASDLVVSRAGAGSIFEIAAMGRPSILIPIPEAADQPKNAACYATTGAAAIIEEPNMLPNLFINSLKKLFENPDRLVQMSKAARDFYRPDSALKLAQIILTIRG